jgi:hypothetical protein
MKREVMKLIVWALFVAVLLGVAIVVGSRNLSRFDSALVAYTFASLFAAFGLTYRYAPPTVCQSVVTSIRHSSFESLHHRRS